MPPEMVEAFRTLSQRRLERFANDGRAVGDVRRTSTTPVDNWSHRSHGYVEDLVFACKSLICGAAGRIRTHDPLVRSAQRPFERSPQPPSPAHLIRVEMARTKGPVAETIQR